MGRVKLRRLLAIVAKWQQAGEGGRAIAATLSASMLVTFLHRRPPEEVPVVLIDQTGGPGIRLREVPSGKAKRRRSR